MLPHETKEPRGKSQLLPVAGERVVVHCQGFNCLGYRDQNGTWKNVFSDESLTGVIDFSRFH